MAEQSPHRHSSDSSNQRETFNRPDSLTNPNVFSDDFAVEPLSSASDPSSPEGDGVSQCSTSFSIPRRPLNSHQSSSRNQDGSSTSRSSFEDGPFSASSSRHSRPLSQSFNYTPNTELASDVPKETSRPHRSISTISNFSMPRTQSPYQGATGPSHPYGMYPQDIGLARSSSSATHSTIRMPDRSYAGSSGPSQPYGMYPQNTVPEEEISPPAGGLRLTPGFPGLGQTYRRRFALGGEDAEDLVGPDGYTEQLPPYTRYPNNVPPKNRVSGLVGPNGGTMDQSQSTESESRTQTGGSQDTLNDSPSGDVMSRNLIIEDSLTQLNSPPVEGLEPSSEGGHFKERVKQKGRRRVCFGRLPLWLAMALLFIIAVLLGAVIGGVLGRVKESQDDNYAKATSTKFLASDAPAHRPTATVFTATAITTTTLIDAIPIASGVSLPSPPFGSFSLNLNSPANMSQTCLTDSELSTAWDCNSHETLNLTVNSDLEATLTYSTISRYQWGAQPPSFQGSLKILGMNDKDDLSKGPAWFFSQSFDKLVVLRENAFPPRRLKRSGADVGEQKDFRALEARVDEREYKDYEALEERDDDWEYEDYLTLEERDGAIRTGYGPFPRPTDRPWFCFWNGTVLEAFIYVNLDSTNTTTDPDSGEDDSASTSITTDTTENGYNSSPAPPDAPSTTSIVDSDTISSPATYQTPFPTTAYGSWNHKRRDTSPINYPKMVKLEEKRNPKGVVAQPYCQQMQIMNDGTASPLSDPFGKLIIRPLNPLNATTDSGSSKRRRSWFEIFGTIGKRDTSANSGCQCQWQIG